jgi:hypothetical protein
MIESGQKTSLLIPSQLPEFVRDNPDYDKFVLFLQAYYEWLEENDNVTDRTKNILNYKDIDETSAEFLDYFYNDFLSYFPKDIRADKVKTTKLAKQLYQSKGTKSSYKFLFRVLYDSDVEFFYTKDAVLKASDGKWYVAKSLKLASNDPNFLSVANYRIFGETTKSIATIENAVLVGSKTEVFISNIERLFQSGEIVRVVDSNNQDVLFDNQLLRAKLVGQISQIRINSNNRGSLYLPNDPVVVYGGLNSNTGIGATASVGTTTKGSIQRIKVENGGYGYRETPNSVINLTYAPGSSAVVGSLDPNPKGIAHVTLVDIDNIGLKHTIALNALNYNFANIVTSNVNTKLSDAFSFISFDTYPISSVVVTNGGGGITQTPVISATTNYNTDNIPGDLKNLGILAPIQISTAGEGYLTNDKIVITGGSGYGAYANVTSVLANGAINTVSYVYGTQNYPLGGMGYRPNELPTLSVNSSNVSAHGADLYVPGILGDGAIFTSITDRVGAISSINIINPGEDYVSAPQVSLKIQDIVVKGLIITNLPMSGDVVYQGTDFENSVYKAYVDSISLLAAYGDPLESLYVLRVYNYNAFPNISDSLKIDGSDIVMNISNIYGGKYGTNGYITYGDGTAKANASFLNGLVVSQGQYLDTTGQPSSFDVLQSEIYNNFTYEITLEKEIAKYRETLLGLLHPTGMKVLGRYALKSKAENILVISDSLESGHTLAYYTEDPTSYGEMIADFDNPSNNIISLYNLNGLDIESVFSSDQIISITTSNGDGLHAKIVSVDNTSNTITIEDNVWLTFYNVATATANSGDDFINITLSDPQPYNFINNGNYSNTDYPLKDIIRTGDLVLVANNTEKIVDSVDYDANIIYLTTTLTDDTNSLLSVNRTISSTDVVITTPVN